MRRLFVFNVAWSVTSDDLMEYLRSENFAVESVQVVIDQNTQRSKGYAFVDFTNEIAATAAKEAFEAGKLHLGGRKMGANEAHPKREFGAKEERRVSGESEEPVSTPKKRRGRRVPVELD
jgi:cold-inducible RNA-binding protein